MSESIVAINEGTGKKLHTRQQTVGANDVQDEYILHGESDLATYVNDPGAASNTTTINKHLVQIMAGASLNVYVHWMGIYQNVLAGAATAVSLQVRRVTTAGTGGTASTFRPLDSTDAAAGATSMVMPSALGTEGVVLWTASMIAVAATPAVVLEDGFLIWQWPPPGARLRQKTIRIPAGATNGIVIKNTVALATATYSIVAEITEKSY